MRANAVQLPAEQAQGSGYWPLVALVTLLAVAISAVAVLYSSHRGRQMFTSLEDLRREENRLQVEWRQLLVERSALAAHARVEQIARERLAMRPPEGPVEVLLP